MNAWGTEADDAAIAAAVEQADQKRAAGETNTRGWFADVIVASVDDELAVVLGHALASPDPLAYVRESGYPRIAEALRDLLVKTGSRVYISERTRAALALTRKSVGRPPSLTPEQAEAAAAAAAAPGATIAAVARLFGVSRSTIYKAIEQGQSRQLEVGESAQ